MPLVAPAFLYLQRQLALVPGQEAFSPSMDDSGRTCRTQQGPQHMGWVPRMGHTREVFCNVRAKTQNAVQCDDESFIHLPYTTKSVILYQRRETTHEMNRILTLRY